MDVNEAKGLGWMLIKAAVVTLQVSSLSPQPPPCLSPPLCFTQYGDAFDDRAPPLLRAPLIVLTLASPLIGPNCCCLWRQVLSYPLWAALEGSRSALLYCRREAYDMWSEHVMLL